MSIQPRSRSPRTLAPGLTLGLAALLAGAIGVGCVGCAGSDDPVAGGSGADPMPDPTGTSAGGGTAVAGAAGAQNVQDPPEPPPGPAPVHGYRVVAEFTHDYRCFTQGLVFAGGQLYESAGKYAASDVRRTDLATGEVLQRRRLASNYFAEGLAAVGDRLIQLTWQNGKGFVYDRVTLEKIGEFSYAGEGWGLTYDGERLILSDGTEYLRFLDPQTFEHLGALRVTDNARPVQRINELEFIRGEIWANVWQSDLIARIDPVTGRVNSWVDLTGIIELKALLVAGEPQNVLNGIAWEPTTETLVVTGKYWPKLFQIEVVE